MHLEPCLNPTRPVVIFQDNLPSHKLAGFCIRHGIHLFNFASKTSHNLQPLDKLFGPLKCKFEQKRSATNLFSKICFNIKNFNYTKFAMAAISKERFRMCFPRQVFAH